MLDIDLTNSTPDDLTEIEEAVKAERIRRQNIAVVEKEIHAVLVNARENGVTPSPEYGAPWRQPEGAHDSYLLGDEVTHEGKRWASTVDANVWEPGVSGWREVREDGTFGEFLAPTGAHDAYRLDDVVTSDGGVYRSVIDHNVWSPRDYPRGWQLVTQDDLDDGAGEDPPTDGPNEPDTPVDLEEPEAPAAWVPGTRYVVGDRVSYQGSTYRVVQAHDSAAHWLPSDLPALYAKEG